MSTGVTQVYEVCTILCRYAKEYRPLPEIRNKVSVRARIKYPISAQWCLALALHHFTWARYTQSEVKKQCCL